MCSMRMWYAYAGTNLLVYVIGAVILAAVHQIEVVEVESVPLPWVIPPIIPGERRNTVEVSRPHLF